MTAFSILKKQGLISRLLVVAPIRPAYISWPNELAKWEHLSGLTYDILHGKDKDEKLRTTKADIVIINPDGLKWLAPNLKKLIGLDMWMLAVDESSQYRNSGTARFKLMKSIMPLFRRRYILTGTPVPNGLEGLWGQIYILDGGASLGRFITYYRNQYFYPDRSGYGYVPQRDAMERVSEKVGPFTLRLSAKDYLTLPKYIVNPVLNSLPPPVRKVYNSLRDELWTLLSGGQELEAPSVATSIMKLRQLANGAVYLPEGGVEELHTEKLDSLEDLVSELGGKPLLIAYHFKHDLARLKQRFPQILTLEDPNTSAYVVKAFGAGTVPLLAVHPQSAGHGIDGLQDSCSDIAWLGPTFDLELYDQLNARIWRQGNKSEMVRIHLLLTENTIDTEIVEALNCKDRDQRSFLDKLKRNLMEH